MRRVLKVLAVVMIVFLAGFLIFLICQEKWTQREREISYEEMEKELRPLELEKTRLRQEMSNLGKKHDEESQGAGSLVLLFTNVDEQIYTDIYPKMESYGFIGTLVLSEDSFPGQEGCLTGDQFKELTEAGWKCAVRWNENVEPEEWLIQCRELAEKAEIVLPKIVYFPDGVYDESKDEFLTRRGFTVAVHHGEKNLPIILSEAGEGLWHPGAMGWVQSGANARLSEATTQGGNLVFTIGSDFEAEQYEEGQFINMLSLADGYCQDGNLMVTDLTGARKYRQELADGQESRDEDYAEQESQLQEQMDELDREMDTITRKYIKE